jgi:CRP-like cAMP-binding protein
MRLADEIQTLPPGQWAAWRRMGERVLYESGAVIFYAGHHPYGLYFLHKGTVQLASRRQRRLIGPGTLLGIGAQTAQVPHPATATCQSACEIYFYSRPELFRLAQSEDPGMLRILAPREARAAG